jgi:hypothetical protein
VDTRRLGVESKLVEDRPLVVPRLEPMVDIIVH